MLIEDAPIVTIKEVIGDLLCLKEEEAIVVQCVEQDPHLFKVVSLSEEEYVNR